MPTGKKPSGPPRAGVLRRTGSRLLSLAGGAATFLLIGQLIFWAALKVQLRNEEDSVQKIFSFLFHGGELSFAGSAVNYKEHHYLNYALNPDAPYLGTKQYSADFKIRRTEPIRPRSAVRWRGLALGGSTTFGEKLAKESDTWPFRLEEQIRRKFGAEYEFINGGVGGYTIEENLIHYLTLLTHLDPDVVVLYVGINDVHPRFFGEIAPDYSNYRIPWRSYGQIIEPPNPLLKHFAPYQYYFLRLHIFPAATRGIGEVAAKRYPEASEWNAGLQRNPPAIYEQNLKNLVALIRGQGRKVLVVPQIYRATKDEERIFESAVREHNEINRSVATAGSIPFAANALTFKLSDGELTDSCHFTSKGAQEFSTLVLDSLIENQLIQ